MAEPKVILEFNHFAKIADEMEDKAGLVVEKTLHRIRQHMDASFDEPKHGKIYQVGGTKDDPVLHTASAPGEAPAVDIGHLKGSVQERMTGPTEGEVSVAAEHAVPLELGTTKMAPRPFLAPAVEKAWPEFVKAMEKLGPQ